MLTDVRHWHDGHRGDAEAMGAALAHRGPDHGATWIDSSAGVVLVHRRLAILDLAPSGQQPMHSHDGRFTAVYNGEVYNFAEIRDAVRRARGTVAWRGHSDTEIVLEAIATWGIHETISRLNGMFAIAVWDGHLAELHLARDRLGKKPLYYGHVGSRFAFCSEVVALSRMPDWRFAADPDAIASYLRHGYVPGVRSAFVGVSKVPPGACLKVQRVTADVPRVEQQFYWRPAALLRNRDAGPCAVHGDGPATRLETILDAAVRTRLVADVPVGVLLSGGIDSSLVAALAQRAAPEPIRTFTIGWANEHSSELDAARGVARHLGTNHEELAIGPQEVIDLVPTVAGIYDEPFADVSAIPTYLVARLAASQIKVVLSGDGADELFGGYTRYARTRALWRIRQLPLVHALARAILRAGGGNRANSADSRWATIVGSLAEPTFESFYRSRVSHTQNPGALLVDGLELATVFDAPEPLLRSSNVERRMMFLDVATYLADDILVKVDRASMAHGLEVRSPFLDDSVLQLAWSLPDDVLLDRTATKGLLRTILYRLVPAALVDRPKTGFAFPIEKWLRGPLRDWARAATSAQRLENSLGLRADRVIRLWQEFESGELRVAGLLWNLVMLSAWHARFAPSSS